MIVELYADDLAELESLRRAGKVRDYRSLGDVRDGMLWQVQHEHALGAQRLAEMEGQAES